jgi:energy-coupling factor transport system permease protein
VSQVASPFAYAPGSSWLHRRSAVPKLAWLAAALAFSLATFHPVPLLLVTAGATAMAISAGVGGTMWRAMRLLGPLAASIVVLQVAAPGTCAGGCTEVARVGSASITAEGLARGLAYISRLLAMESSAVVLLVTTRPADLFGALRRLRVPHPVALLLATTMQLVPALERELAIVLDAQRARGMRATGVRALVPALLPVFVSAFERVSRLAIAMEARGYGSSVARTSYRTDAFGPGDRALAAGAVAAGVAGVVAGTLLWGASSVPPLVMPAWAALAMVGAAGLAFAGLIGAALVAVARA